MTEEQKAKIEKAINDSYKTGFCTIETLIVAGIKAYDEMKNVEDAKVAAKAAGAENNDSGAYVVFRPHGKISEAMKAVRVFHSKYEMLKKLSSENNNDEIRINEYESCIVIDRRSGWLHSQKVYGIDKNSYTYALGICDCKTFKKA